MEDKKEVSHEDIYHRLGSLEGKLDSAISKMSDFRGDLDKVFGRLHTIESNVSKVIGVAIVLSLAMPIFMESLMGNTRIHFTNETSRPHNR